MAAADDAPILTGTSWEDKRWWSGMLRRDSALDYFAGSPFYDRTCLNEQLRMQISLTPKEVSEKLSRLPGLIYQLDEAKSEEVAPVGDEPAHTLYVIRKLRRDAKGKESTLRYYYCLDGVVYESPTIDAIMRARLLKLAWHLQQAWDLSSAAPPAPADGAATGPTEAEDGEGEGGEQGGQHGGRGAAGQTTTTQDVVAGSKRRRGAGDAP